MAHPNKPQGGTGPRNEFRGGGYPGDTERKGYQHQGAGYGGDYGGYGHGEWQGTGGYENRGQDRRHGGPYAGQGGYGQERAGDRRRPKPE
jgi:23S rRNA pseudouridine2605 synthase